MQFLLQRPPFYSPDFGDIEISLASQWCHEMDLTVPVDLKEWVCAQPLLLKERYETECVCVGGGENRSTGSTYTFHLNAIVRYL